MSSEITRNLQCFTDFEIRNYINPKTSLSSVLRGLEEKVRSIFYVTGIKSESTDRVLIDKITSKITRNIKIIEGYFQSKKTGILSTSDYRYLNSALRDMQAAVTGIKKHQTSASQSEAEISELAKKIHIFLKKNTHFYTTQGDVVQPAPLKRFW